MDFSKEKLTLILWTKSYDVTIQMKPLCINLHMVLFVFHRNLRLAKFGSERVNDSPNSLLEFYPISCNGISFSS